jgi:hypothetical protein
MLQIFQLITPKSYFFSTLHNTDSWNNVVKFTKKQSVLFKAVLSGI